MIKELINKLKRKKKKDKNDDAIFVDLDLEEKYQDFIFPFYDNRKNISNSNSKVENPFNQHIKFYKDSKSVYSKQISDVVYFYYPNKLIFQIEKNLKFGITLVLTFYYTGELKEKIVKKNNMIVEYEKYNSNKDLILKYKKNNKNNITGRFIENEMSGYEKFDLNYIDGKLCGIQKFFSNGKIKQIDFYEHGFFICTLAKFDDNGKIIY
ncbi:MULTISPECIES: hypothetical protein [unclassified Fusobacterium]|uniref:hypothetical protein n=1 Tax=unclassified Fusobacterium TaxID=2648384 RepID=UPI001B8B96DB|nr:MULTISPECIES: hypothetical protein [unclassified Fusobacterium]MBR8701035.1 hypothetical protein [Fusobacterium sp. DD45]MBR8710807.1 hypothetical protein [Fusobacterium sp. DD28]MBR8751415.1 hypothetical protein [Fusobacterium sp. DD26]